jgi:iron(III) transport system ATP-binding protein
VRGAGTEGAADVLIRPEQIHLRTEGTGVPARVDEVSFYGHDAAVRLTLLPDGPRVVARVTGERDLPSPGARVGLVVTGDALTYPLSA